MPDEDRERIIRARRRITLLIFTGLTVLCAVPVNVSPSTSTTVAVVGLALMAAVLAIVLAQLVFLGFAMLFGDMFNLIPDRVYDAAILLKNIGPGLLAASYLLVYVCLYLLVWGSAPSSLAGVSNPGHANVARVGEFVFLSIGAAFGGPPNGITAVSAFSQTVVTSQILSGALLIGVYTAATQRIADVE